MMTHGQRQGRKQSPTYRCWGNMLSRCRNPNLPKYPQYGGKGIRVCERWLRFENFLADMGEMPHGFTLGRIDNAGNYCKANCRWETWRQQRNNRSNTRLLTLRGVTRPLNDWARQLGVTPNIIHMRIFRYGWSVERALTTKAGTRKQ